MFKFKKSSEHLKSSVITLEMFRFNEYQKTVHCTSKIKTLFGLPLSYVAIDAVSRE